VTSIPAPEDSEEWPTSYIRGSHGLEATVRASTLRTGSQLQYIGEWHSHPDGHPAEPSDDDCKTLCLVAELHKSRWLSACNVDRRRVGIAMVCWKPLEPARDFNGLLIVTGEAPLESSCGM